MRSDKVLKRVLAILLVFILIFMAFLPVFSIITRAASDDDTKSNIEKLKGNTAALKSQIDEIVSEKKDAMEEKQRIDSELDAIMNEINAVDKNIEILDAQIAEKESEIEVATKKAEAQKNLYLEHIRLMCESDTKSIYFEALLNASSLRDFLDRVEVIKELTSYEKEIKDEMEKILVEINDAKSAIENIKADRIAVKQGLEEKREIYNSKIEENDKLMEQLKSDEAAYTKAYEEARANEESLKSSIGGKLSSSSGSAVFVGGQFGWPTDGYYTLTDTYGMRIHPTLHVYKLHTGIDIAAPRGAVVKAANDGNVVVAGYNAGYGNYVIIDHGGGYATLYGHASSLNVKSGDKVKRGQTIMYVGSTGFSTGPHLHFEIMVDGRTVDPLNYFK